jgi:hypothetical protein
LPTIGPICLKFQPAERYETTELDDFLAKQGLTKFAAGVKELDVSEPRYLTDVKDVRIQGLGFAELEETWFSPSVPLGRPGWRRKGLYGIFLYKIQPNQFYTVLLYNRGTEPQTILDGHVLGGPAA